MKISEYLPTMERYTLLVTSDNPHEKIKKVLAKLEKEGHKIIYQAKISSCINILQTKKINGIIIPVDRSCGRKANALEEELDKDNLQIPIFEELLLTPEFN